MIYLVPTAIVLTAIATPAAAQQASREFRTLGVGETATVFGGNFTAKEPATALFSLSTELVTVAVIEGSITQGSVIAKAGEALVAPVDGGKVRRFRFDASRLAATLSPEWAGTADAPLRKIAARQKRQRFWGMLEPVNVNANAPVRPELEAVRQSYLGNETIASLRRDAAGDPQRLASLTAKRFAQAVVSGDAIAVANLIDPKPFTDTGSDAAAWQSVRLALATKLTGDAALKSAMATDPAAVTDDQTAFDAGGFRIRLIPRDRAMFVMSVEGLQ